MFPVLWTVTSTLFEFSVSLCKRQKYIWKLNVLSKGGVVWMPLKATSSEGFTLSILPSIHVLLMLEWFVVLLLFWFVSIHAYIFVFESVCVCMYMCVYACMHVCVCTCVCLMLSLFFWVNMKLVNSFSQVHITLLLMWCRYSTEGLIHIISSTRHFPLLPWRKGLAVWTMSLPLLQPVSYTHLTLPTKLSV